MRNANKTNGKHSRIEAKSFGRVEDNINAIPIMKDAGGKKCSLQPSPLPSLRKFNLHAIQLYLEY